MEFSRFKCHEYLPCHLLLELFFEQSLFPFGAIRYYHTYLLVGDAVATKAINAFELGSAYSADLGNVI